LIGSVQTAKENSIILDHMLVTNQSGWKRAESLRHPTLEVTINVDDEDYAKL